MRRIRFIALCALAAIALFVFSRRESARFLLPIHSPNPHPDTLPKVQFPFTEPSIQVERREAVRTGFHHAWSGYKKHAFGHDEVMPLSGKPRDAFLGYAATLVDSLDSLWIMGMRDEFEEALAAVAKINFQKPNSDVVPVFEINIRYLGGLLGAYDISGQRYKILLQKAVELGEFLLKPFDTENGMPIAKFYWKLDIHRADSMTLIAEIGSLSLEFTRLSQLTGDLRYFNAIQKVTDALDRSQMKTSIPGLWPAVVDPARMDFDGNYYTFGAWADSLYEYLPKEYLLLNGHSQYLRMYDLAYETAKETLFFRPMVPGNEDILFSGGSDVYMKNKTLRPEVQHLGCFVGGMVGMGAKLTQKAEELEVAKKLTQSCVWAYGSTVTGIMPETFRAIPCGEPCEWNQTQWLTATGRSEKEAAALHLPEGMSIVTDPRYLLRPEAIESVFYMYRITGDRQWQDKGWTMFEALRKHTQVPIAFAAIADVTNPAPQMLDNMESFFFAETLKYYFLLFSDSEVVSLDDYVLNTEAHPFKRRDRLFSIA